MKLLIVIVMGNAISEGGLVGVLILGTFIIGFWLFLWNYKKFQKKTNPYWKMKAVKEKINPSKELRKIG